MDMDNIRNNVSKTWMVLIKLDYDILPTAQL